MNQSEDNVKSAHSSSANLQAGKGGSAARPCPGFTTTQLLNYPFNSGKFAG
jgi:hypothetical protein